MAITLPYYNLTSFCINETKLCQILTARYFTLASSRVSLSIMYLNNLTHLPICIKYLFCNFVNKLVLWRKLTKKRKMYYLYFVHGQHVKSQDPNFLNKNWYNAMKIAEYFYFYTLISSRLIFSLVITNSSKNLSYHHHCNLVTNISLELDCIYKWFEKSRNFSMEGKIVRATAPVR